jgi:hypothetical protein
VSRTIQPWDAITRPNDEGMISTLRVDASLVQDIFWGVDHQGHRMLVLHCSEPLPSGYRLPELREIEFRVERRGDGALIALSLIGAEKADLFRVLCDDLIGAIGNVASGQDAVRRLMERSYRWHHLLRSSGRRLLSEPEQRGLLAELIVLRDVAMPTIGTESAIAAWHGPLGAHQDFLLPGYRVEVKSTEPQNPRKFSVSSEHQLDRAGAGGDVVSLALVEIARSDEFAAVGETLVEVVDSIRRLCESAGGRASLEYEQRLIAAGFTDDHAYQATKWTFKAPLLIDVGVDFPSIGATALPASVSRVSYDCDLGGIGVRQAPCPFGDLRGTSRDS